MHARTQKCTHMHSQPCTNANCWKMLMPVIISEPPLSSLPQHSFRGHRSEKESVPSWLLLIGQTGRPLPGYQLTLTIHREDFEYLPSFSKWFFFYYYYYHFLLIGVFILTLSIVLSVCSCFAYVFLFFYFYEVTFLLWIFTDKNLFTVSQIVYDLSAMHWEMTINTHIHCWNAYSGLN